MEFTTWEINTVTTLNFGIHNLGSKEDMKISPM